MKNKIHILILLLLAGQIAHTMEPTVEQLGITTDTKVELVSAQGRSFMLPEQCAQQSPVLRAMLSSSLQEGATKKIQLKNINTQTLSILSQLLQTQEGQRGDILTSLINDSDLAIKLHQAAHYLDIEDLVTVHSPHDVVKLLRNALWSNVQVPCLQTLQGHTSVIASLVVDGDRIISGSYDNTIKIWDKTTGNCVQTLQGHTRVIESLVVDGDRIISGSYDKTIKIWDKTTGNCLQTLQGHINAIQCLVVDGDMIISGSYDKTIKIWDKNTGNCLQTLHGHTDCISCLVVDGDRIISGSWDNTIKIWDKTTGNCLQTLQGHACFIQCLVVDGDMIISGSYDKTIKIWDKTTGNCLQTLQGHTNAIECVVADGDRIIFGSYDKTIKIWDIAVPKQWSNFVVEKLPMPYATLLQQFNNALVSGRKISLTEQQQEILQHFLETIQDNWGDRAMKAIKDALLKLQVPLPWATQNTCTLV
jgi:WD40 repeat protein